MDSSEVDRLLDAIVPGIAETTDSAVALVTGRDLTWSVQYKGFKLNRSYRGLNKSTGKTIRAVITTEYSGISQPTLEAQYGSPECEVFYPAADLAISVIYGAKDSARRIEFSQPTPLLNTNLEARPIDSDAVDQFVEEFAPSSQRVGILKTYALLSGSNRFKTSIYDSVTLTRSYHGAELLSAAVNWK